MQSLASVAAVFGTKPFDSTSTLASRACDYLIMSPLLPAKITPVSSLTKKTTVTSMIRGAKAAGLVDQSLHALHLLLLFLGNIFL